MEFTPAPRWGLLLHWLPAAVGVAIIAGESTSTMSAANTSRWLLPIWIHLFGAISMNHWAMVHIAIRKGGHFTGYGMLSVAFFHGWKSSFKTNSYAASLWRMASLLAIFCTLAVAVADEYHQSFLPGRSGSPFDVLIDMCGALTAQALVIASIPLFLGRREERSNSRAA